MVLNSQRGRGRPTLSLSELNAGRDRIAAVAEALFRDEGVTGVSIRRLAQAAGCAPATVYAYFDGKPAILQRIWSRFFDALFDELAACAAAECDPRARLLAIARGYVRYWINHPDRYRMAFMAEGVAPDDVARFVTGGILDRFALFDTALAPFEVEETARKRLFETLICGLQGIAHNLVTIQGYDWEDAERLAELLAGALVDRRE
jgi:AcrR family transcriptional regulator